MPCSWRLTIIVIICIQFTILIIFILFTVNFWFFAVFYFLGVKKSNHAAWFDFLTPKKYKTAKNRKSASNVICPNKHFNACFWNFGKILKNEGRVSIFTKKIRNIFLGGIRGFPEIEKYGSNFFSHSSKYIG